MISDLDKKHIEEESAEIAVIGMAGHYPDMDNAVALWEYLISGVSGIVKASIGDVESGHCIGEAEKFDPLFFDSDCILSGECSDDGLFLELAWHLLEQAGQTAESLKRNFAGRVGLFVATQPGSTSGAHEAGNQDGGRDERMVRRVSRSFRLDGPVARLEAAGPNAQRVVELACRSLTDGDCTLAIVFASRLPMQCADGGGVAGAKALDGAAALPLGEGVAAMLLQPLAHAVADGHAQLALVGADGRAGALQVTPRTAATGPAPVPSTEIIVLSANTSDVLRVLAWRLLEHIKRGALVTMSQAGGGASLDDLAFTLQSCREAMRCRLALVASSFEEIVRGLEECLLSKETQASGVQKIVAYTQAGSPITLYRSDPDHTSPMASLLYGSAGEAMVNALLLEGDLGNVALCWAQGAQIDWHQLRKDRPPRKVVLPVYPFFISKQASELLREGFSSLRGSGSGPAPSGILLAPSGAVAEALATIWQELFGLERIGRFQNFFELGGDSQLGMHLISRVRDMMQVDFPLSCLYETPTIAMMSEKISHLIALSTVPSAHAGGGVDHDFEEGIIL